MNMSRITRFVFVLAVAVMIMGFSACDQLVSILTSGDMPEPPEVGVTVGVVLPLSGQYAALYGHSMLNGFELARNEINSSQVGAPGIAFITADDEATVDGAKAAFKKLIEQDGVPVILGPGFSSQARETFPIATENGVVAFSSISSASGINMAGDANFRAGLITSRLNPPGVRATHTALRYQNVATMYDEADTYSTIGHGDLTGALTALGVEILTTETFTGGSTDFSAQLTRIKDLNPDAIFVSALSAEMDDILMKGRELGIPYSVPFIIPELWNTEAAAGEAAEGTISFNGWSNFASTPGNHAFIENYLAAYGTDPDPWAAQSYATLHILDEAGTRAGSADPVAIAEALRGISGLDTILGSFSFDKNGDAIYEPFVHIVKNGKLEPFDGSEMSSGDDTTGDGMIDDDMSSDDGDGSN